MSQETIHAALQALDPKNDDHWTADGLPRLDVVKAGTRAAVTAAAPNFSRANPVLTPKPKEDEVPAAIKPDYKTSFQMESSEFGALDDDDEGDKPAVHQDAASVVEKVLAATVVVDQTLEQLEAAKLVKAKADEELNAALQEHDRAVRAAAVPVPPHVQTQHVLMGFLASQTKQPHVKAQIDKVMERKQGYGLKRPTFTPRG